MAILGSVQISGFVAPSSELDTYPSHKAKYGHGGHRSVADSAELAAIPTDRKEDGMTAYVVADDTTYILKAGVWQIFAGSSGGGGIGEVFATVVDRDAADTTLTATGSQAYVTETKSLYEWNGVAWDLFLDYNMYNKPEVDAMLAGAAVGLTYSLRDIPAGDDAITQMNALIGMTEGELTILNDNAIYRYDGTTWNEFAVLSAGHTHSYNALTELPDLGDEAIVAAFNGQKVTDEASVPIVAGLYYAEAEKTFWVSDGVASTQKTSFEAKEAYADLDDVDLSGLLDGDQLVWDGVAEKWKPVTPVVFTFDDVYKKLVGYQFTVADAAARAVLASMVEGDIVYQSDTKETYEYDGSAWVLKTDFKLATVAVSGDYDDLDNVPVIEESVIDVLYAPVEIASAVDRPGTPTDGQIVRQLDDGKYFKFVEGLWVEKTSFAIESAGEPVYRNLDPIVAAIGGIDVGETFVDVSMSDMFNKLLYPYQKPAFTGVNLGVPTELEVGDTFAGGATTVTWSTTNSVNVEVDTIEITDVGNASAVATGEADDGTADVTWVAVTKGAPGTHTWKIEGTDTNSDTFSKSDTCEWKWAVYTGSNALTTLTEVDVKALTKELRSGYAKTYSLPADNYKWICYPASMGAATTFKDASNNFDVAMMTVDTVSVTNDHGVTTVYNCHRTYNTIGNSINVIVS